VHGIRRGAVTALGMYETEHGGAPRAERRTDTVIGRLTLGIGVLSNGDVETEVRGVPEKLRRTRFEGSAVEGGA